MLLSDYFVIQLAASKQEVIEANQSREQVTAELRKLQEEVTNLT